MWHAFTFYLKKSLSRTKKSPIFFLHFCLHSISLCSTLLLHHLTSPILENLILVYSLGRLFLIWSVSLFSYIQVAFIRFVIMWHAEFDHAFFNQLNIYLSLNYIERHYLGKCPREKNFKKRKKRKAEVHIFRTKKI